MDKLKIEYVDINSIKPYNKNPRKNEEAIPYVMESIKQFGFKNPVILDKNNVCIYADDLTDEQIKAFRLADNKVGEIAEWDIDLLDTELDDILNIDMSDFGFDLDLEDEDIERKDLSDKEFEKYEIIITCENELDLQKKYEKLEEEGYECRISTL